ncbi:hypothetical protein G5B47_02430 [Paenibacillus sp. 7124]|uniref:Uncharacterized protein n=1 Tax=Paenibacillus apii TaxID=1850370 RepID=A0A6M1PG93_9BACL|nr:hypothetical protein [Paenibacillus apii]NGM81265.1 hypothetical protein [Paenibacillus apii]
MALGDEHAKLIAEAREIPEVAAALDADKAAWDSGETPEQWLARFNAEYSGYVEEDVNETD